MNKTKKQTRPPLWGRRDILPIAAALLLALSVWLCLSLSGREGSVAVISQNGRELYRIELQAVTEPYRLELPGECPAVLLFEPGSVCFEEAACPDKLCVRTGKLSRAGEAAVCLPAGITVRIEGDNRQIDAVTG